MGNNFSAELCTIWDEAKALIEQGNYDEAIEIYKYILIRYSENNIAVEYASAYLGDIYLTLRQLNLAESYIKKAVSYRPHNPRYHYLLGFAYSIESKWSKAINEFQLAVERESNNSEYLRALGWAMHCSGNKENGLEYLHRAIDLAPTNVNILTDLAAAYLSNFQFRKAREYAEKAVQIDPDSNAAKEILDFIGRIQNKKTKDDL